MQGYLSIDIETTGLDPKENQILQISAVWDDLVTPIEELKHVTCYIDNGDKLTGNVFALHLNSGILKAILDGRSKKPTKYAVGTGQYAKNLLLDFIEVRGEGKSVFVAGKNAAGFDIPFLKEYMPIVTNKFKHRVIDVGSMYAWLDENTPVPDLNRINKYLGRNEVSHDAYDDACDVIRAVRYFHKMRFQGDI